MGGIHLKTAKLFSFFVILTLGFGQYPFSSTSWTQAPAGQSAPDAQSLQAPSGSYYFSAVASGSFHTCGLTASGGVKCWGRNLYGELGDGSTTDSDSPVDVVGLGSGVTAISVGDNHSCALLSGGGVKCWGGNGSGQLGDGTTTDSSTPVQVLGLASGVSAIDSGSNHTCALLSGGGVKCWGTNYSGQLGDGSILDRSSPVAVVGLASGVASISTGGYHTCALISGGGVKCWGANFSGQVGDSTTTDRSSPVDVVGLVSGVNAVAAGHAHTCAMTGSGGVKCWGDNGTGALGDGSTKERDTPVGVVGLSSGAAAIDAGIGYSCALVNAGVKCWGWNKYNQLGDYTIINHSTPVDVLGLESGVNAFSSGGYQNCAWTAGGGFKCWGRNMAGLLGDGTSFFSEAPFAWHSEGVKSAIDLDGISERSLRIDSQGVPHIAYVQSGFLYHAWRDLNGWQVQKVSSASVSSPALISPPSLALGAGDIPYISFHDSGGLKVAIWNGAAWDIQTVDAAGTGRSSIALDRQGIPHISYDSSEGLKYASLTGSGWVSVPVDNQGSASSMAIDSSGTPHIGYFASGVKVNYAIWNGSDWGIQTVYDVTGQLVTLLGDLSLALDPAGHPHMSFSIGYGSVIKDYDLFYADWTGSRWKEQFLATYRSISGISLAANKAGQAWIAYGDPSYLRLAVQAGDAWDMQVVDRDNSARLASLALDPQGQARLVYLQQPSSGSGLYYAEQLAPPVLEKKVSPQTGVHPGEPVTYTLNVLAPWRSVLITDTLPAQVEYITGTLSTAIAPNAVYSPTTRTILWQGTLTDTLQTIQFQVMLKNSGDPTSTPLVTNTAQLSDPEHGRSASAFAILNGWNIYIPFIGEVKLAQ
jgi:alpha-tubulin suppressor-like RCC1 family protein